MRLKILLATLLSIAALPAAAETTTVISDEVIVVTGASAPAATTGLPTKGMNKAAVTRSYGQPAQKRPTVGGSSRRQPPITRWDYDSFSVIFENDHVVDTVERSRPAPIKVRDGLARGTP